RTHPLDHQGPKPIADAFRLFTEGWVSWFPVETHHARGPVVDVVFEGRRGGQLIEVCFFSEGDAATRVELEHRAWERLGERGRIQRSRYLNGWPPVLARFAETAGAREGRG